MKYGFKQWENGETTNTRIVSLTQDMTVVASYAVVTRRLTFQSQPINVQAVVNGQPVNAGGSIDLPEGTQITIVVPSEVSV